MLQDSEIVGQSADQRADYEEGDGEENRGFTAEVGRMVVEVRRKEVLHAPPCPT